MPYEAKIRWLGMIRAAVQPRPSNFREFIRSTLAFKSTPQEARWLPLLEPDTVRATDLLVRASRAKVERARSTRKFLVRLTVAFVAIVAIVGVEFVRGRHADPPVPTATSMPPAAETPVPTPTPAKVAPPDDFTTHQVQSADGRGTPLRDTPGKGKVAVQLVEGTRVQVVGEPEGPKKKWLRVLVTSGDARTKVGYVAQDSLKPVQGRSP